MLGQTPPGGKECNLPAPATPPARCATTTAPLVCSALSVLGETNSYGKLFPCQTWNQVAVLDKKMCFPVRHRSKWFAHSWKSVVCAQCPSAVKPMDLETGFRVGHGNVLLC